MPKQIESSEDSEDEVFRPYQPDARLHLSFYECHCSMNVIYPSNQLIEGFTRLCERCGGYITHDKYEAYKQSLGISGYDEDNKDSEAWFREPKERE